MRKSKLIPYLVLTVAMSLAGTAAYYSVFGISKLFSAQATAVIVMASILEIAKLTTASYLERFWNTIHWLRKTYLISALIVLMMITSLGIYGFLVSAYQETAYKVELVDKQVNAQTSKLVGYQQQLSNLEKQQQSYDSNIAISNDNILKLSEGFSNNVVQYTDANGNVITTQSSSTRRALQEQMRQQTSYRDGLVDKREALTPKYNAINDTIMNIEMQILQLGTDNDVAAEIGPLKYVAGVVGSETDVVINWFILLFIFVFDPLAILLLISANAELGRIGNEHKTKPLPPTPPEDKPEDIPTPPEPPTQENLVAGFGMGAQDRSGAVGSKHWGGR
tara:strand:- start:431 stop:1435 length:1005 start_codon:yes stop_codon:yes gene_type:complete